MGKAIRSVVAKHNCVEARRVGGDHTSARPAPREVEGGPEGPE